MHTDAHRLAGAGLVDLWLSSFRGPSAALRVEPLRDGREASGTMPSKRRVLMPLRTTRRVFMGALSAPIVASLVRPGLALGAASRVGRLHAFVTDDDPLAAA